MDKSLKLTTCQEVMLIAGYHNKKYDYCMRGNKNTMRALVDRDLANYTGGFGWKYGAIIELTNGGKTLAKTMVDKQ